MTTLERELLERLIKESAEPVLVARIDQADWPVVLCNPAFDAIAGGCGAGRRAFADVIEQVVGRELALEVSETLRSGQENSIPVELDEKEYLLVLKPMSSDAGAGGRYYAAFWRGAEDGSAPGDHEIRQALFKAKRRIRDLSREDSVTGLLNAVAFREVLAHDWAVAAREKGSLALVLFTLDDFDAYLEVFGRHATDSCLRRVAQAIRRCLRRASDVAARLGDDQLIVLSHSSDEHGIAEFAAKISAAVRELGLHHPRSGVDRFVTVSSAIAVTEAGQGKQTAVGFLERLLKS